MRYKGKITNWNDDKGFGFIEPSLGGKQVFVHIKAFKKRNHRPMNNQIVIYAMSKDKTGRDCAKDVLRAGEKNYAKNKTVKSNKKHKLSFVVFILFLIFFTYLVLADRLPLVLMAIYIFISFFTALVYAIDKSAAQKGKWRTPESTLHLLALIGGWPGAMYAQQKLRHKSKKQPFRMVFWITVVINIFAVLWLASSKGADALKMFNVVLS